MKKYRATVQCRVPYTDTYKEVYRGEVLWSSIEEAEDDAYDNRCHYKERILILEEDVE